MVTIIINSWRVYNKTDTRQGFMTIVIVTVQGFIKVKRIINPKRVYETVMYGKRVYDNLRKAL